MRRDGVTRRDVLGSVGVVSVASALTPHSLASGTPSGDVPEVPRVSSMPAFQATLQTARAQRLADGRRVAVITGGVVRGDLLSGIVQPGHVEWRIDDLGGSVEISAEFDVQRTDGSRVQVTDRAVHPAAVQPAAASGLVTAPRVHGMEHEPAMAQALLVGRLDTRLAATGEVTLHAFRVV
jgi:hypothetical protein